MATKAEILRDIKKDMTDKWTEMVSLMSKYETQLRESDGGKSRITESDSMRLRVENEEMKIKIKVIESKWKSFKDEAIKNEVRLQRRIKQLEATNQRLKDTVAKMSSSSYKGKPGPQKKRKRQEEEEEEEEPSEDEEGSEDSNLEKFGNVRVVTDPKRVRFHQAAIINGKRQRKPKFSHLKDEYAIDIKGMDKKLLDADDDVAGVGGLDEGEMSGDDDELEPEPEKEDVNWCYECSKKFTNPASLRRHLKEEHGVLNPGSTFSCDKCSIFLASAVAYNRHMKYLHGQDEKPFTCDVCHVAFATEQNLQSHIDNKVDEKKGLGKKAEDKAPKIEISVIQPPKKTTPAKPAQKRNICPLCFMVFPTSMEMNEHMKKHRQIKGGATYTCENCEEIFYKKSALAEHDTRCPKRRSFDDKLWDTIEFPEASQVLEEQANYKDESLIDPELGPTADLEAATEEAADEAEVAAAEAVLPAAKEQLTESLVMDTTEAKDSTESPATTTTTEPQIETVSIVDESGQPLGQAQVSVDPVSGAVTYVALGQNGEQLPLSQVMEGGDTNELLLSIINQANAAAK